MHEFISTEYNFVIYSIISELIFYIFRIYRIKICILTFRTFENGVVTPKLVTFILTELITVSQQEK